MATRLTRTAPRGVCGQNWSRRSSKRSATIRASSIGRTIPSPVRPCLRELARDRSFPSGVLGPVDFWALRRLASIRAWEVGMVRVSRCRRMMGIPSDTIVSRGGGLTAFLGILSGLVAFARSRVERPVSDKFGWGSFTKICRVGRVFEAHHVRRGRRMAGADCPRPALAGGAGAPRAVVDGGWWASKTRTHPTCSNEGYFVGWCRVFEAHHQATWPGDGGRGWPSTGARGRSGGVLRGRGPFDGGPRASAPPYMFASGGIS